MSKKTSSLLTILAVYAFVAVAGVIVYMFLPSTMGLVYRVLIADLVATILIWIISLLLKNASLYDPYWSVIPPLILLLLMLEKNNWSLSLVLLLVTLSVWAIRLTYNWAKLWSDFKHVDWRYKNFQKMAPKWYWLISFLAVMFFPTIIVYAQLVGATILVEATNLNFGVYSIIGAFTILLAAFIQLTADTQMQRFKNDFSNKGQIMRDGLWKYSRHPNYLGEIMVWWGVYLFYVQQFGLDLVLVAPVIMTLMFIFISVPLMEKKILKTRPEYKVYIKEAGMLIPFPKRKIFKDVSEEAK
ncbi:MAG TPA: DUF1295 domain-containing protein [Bacilli bacterium]|nr:DUF1295 domain-containing protein [Bacilli bacterium]